MRISGFLLLWNNS